MSSLEGTILWDVQPKEPFLDTGLDSSQYYNDLSRRERSPHGGEK